MFDLDEFSNFFESDDGAMSLFSGFESVGSLGLNMPIRVGEDERRIWPS
jgi:hypothetical protein